jgi:uncharacterized membrane protein YfcA
MLALAIGLVLGLTFSVLGAGGGLVAVPLLTWLFGLTLADAAGTSLAVIFVAAVAAAVGYARAGRVEWRTVGLLGPVAMIGSTAGARLNPLVPERLAALLFALVVLGATASLYVERPAQPRRAPTPLLLASGLGLGGLTGLLGVGGGFLVVPALVTLARLPLPLAIGTSTALVSLSSLAGAVTTLASRPHLASIALPIGLGAMVGGLAGVRLSGRLPERLLRLGFTLLAIGVGLSMLLRAVRA